MTDSNIGMKARVQVCGCFMDGEDVVSFVPDTVAEFYGVYVGVTTMEWAADFFSKEEALAYAQTLTLKGYKLDDRTFMRRES